MTTIRQLITDSYREAGIIEIEGALDTNQFAEGLRRFNAMFNSLFDNELGEPLLNANYGEQGLTNNYALDQDTSDEVDTVFVPSNTRLILNLAAATTLYLDPNPRDGARFAVVDNAGNLATKNATINANGRHIEGAASVVLSTNGLNREWFFRADTGNWVKVADFIDGDSSPFPEAFDDFLITMLAVRINPRHGAQSSDEMMGILKRGRRQFRNRYRQVSEQESELGLQRLTGTKYYWRFTNSV